MTTLLNTASRLLNALIDFIYEAFWNYINGDRVWGLFRQVLLLAMVDLVAIAMADTFEVANFMRMWHDIIFPTILFTAGFWTYMFIVRDVMEAYNADSKIFWRLFFFLLFLAAAIWLELKVVKRIGMTSTYVGYYLIPPLAVIIIATFAAAKYIQDIYNLESYSVALLYVASSFWGIAYPKLTVEDGQYQIDAGKVNRLAWIGGPGYLTIKPGNAVIMNDVDFDSEVFSSRRVFLSHYGSVVSIVDLNNQRGSVPSVSAVTKDGIPITVRNIEMRFRVWSSSQITAPSTPYPYDEQSIRDSVYQLVVTEKGVNAWSEMVKNMVVGQITGYIAERQFDEIVTPTLQKNKPRHEISRQLFSADTEKKLKRIGAKLLWYDIGHFEADRAALDQRLETWSAKWVGNANVVRARGEAQRSAYQELGRAEAHA